MKNSTGRGTGSPDIVLVNLIYKQQSPNMYVKLQAKLTAKESKYLSNSSK